MTPTRPDIEYYDWLIGQIDVPNGKTYGGLFEQMHNTEFVWTVPNDDNRVHDGQLLRDEWLEVSREKNIPYSFKGGATFLEVLVALSRRVAFVAGGKSDEWAWRLIKNLHLIGRSDPVSPSEVRLIKDTLEQVIWRTYRPSGLGGFFPLNKPTADQTQIEIWSQMNAYANERTTD